MIVEGNGQDIIPKSKANFGHNASSAKEKEKQIRSYTDILFHISLCISLTMK